MPQPSQNANDLKSAASGLLPDAKVAGLGTPTPVAPTVPVTPAPAAGAPAAAAPAAPATPVPGGQPAVVPPVITMDTPFGKQTFGTPAPDVPLKTFQDVQTYAKAFGIEVATPDDFKKLFPQLSELNQKTQEAEQYKMLATSVQQTIANLPEDVRVLVDAAIAGNTDLKPLFETIVRKNTLNLDKAYEDHREIDLINMYSDKKYSKEELDALDPKVRESLSILAKSRYTVDQGSYLQRKQAATAQVANKKQALATSVEASIAQMIKTYPGMDKSSIEKVRQTMLYGLKTSLFNPDDTYRVDAAEKIAMQEFGKEVIAQNTRTIGELVNFYQSKGASKATEVILGRSDRPAADSGKSVQDRQNQIAKAVKEQTSFLNAH